MAPLKQLTEKIEPFIKMKKKFLNTITTIIFLGLTTLMLVGCKKEKDDLNEDFTYVLIGNGGIEVTPTSGTGFHTWDFGGIGRAVQGTGESKKFYYKQNGTYTIKHVIDNTKNSKEKTIQVTISDVPSKVKISYAKLIGFEALDPFGNPWDSDATDPDIIFVYKANNVVQYTSSTTANVSTSQLPLINNPTSPIEVTDLTNSYINIYCTDDNTSSTFAIGGVEMSLINHIAACSNCGSVIYPVKYSNASFEIGLEWLP
jgi:uncharacterized protein YcfL